MGVIRRIVTYDELPDKRQLFYQGLGFSGAMFTKLEDARTEDDRLPPELAFFALDENDLVLGQVGVAFSKTKTVEGVLTVGGIWGVVTSPAHLRRGIATRLMERAHEFFRERDSEIVGLGTGRSLVAHSMYEKLGYHEVDSGEASRARKWSAQPSAKFAEPEIMRYGKKYAKGVYDVYASTVKSFFGYVVRPENFVERRAFFAEVEPKNVYVCLENGVVSGYLALHETRPTVVVYEIKAKNQDVYSRMLRWLETKYTGVPITIDSGFDFREEKWLQEAGFKVIRTGFGVWMMKDLKDRPFRTIKKLYAVDEGKMKQGTWYDIY